MQQQDIKKKLRGTQPGNKVSKGKKTAPQPPEQELAAPQEQETPPEQEVADEQ